MNFQSDDYEISSELDTDILLVDLPMNLIREQIRDQINEPLLTNVNYIENVIDIIRTLRTQYEEDPETLATINNFTVDFFSFLINEIDGKFDMGLVTEGFDIDQYIQVGSSLYTFLILQYQKNVTRFIYRFIVKNKKMLVESFEGQTKKKDVTTIAVKKKIKNKDDALIVSNLPSVINYIMNLEIDAMSFLKYIGGDSVYEGAVIKNLIQDGLMIGNFTQAYLNTIRVDYDQVLDDIQTEVKLKLTKKEYI